MTTENIEICKITGKFERKGERRLEVSPSPSTFSLNVCFFTFPLRAVILEYQYFSLQCSAVSNDFSLQFAASVIFLLSMPNLSVAWNADFPLWSWQCFSSWLHRNGEGRGEGVCRRGCFGEMSIFRPKKRVKEKKNFPVGQWRGIFVMSTLLGRPERFDWQHDGCYVRPCTARSAIEVLPIDDLHKLG